MNKTEIFTQKFWEDFTNFWNKSEFKSDMSNFGKMVLKIEDFPERLTVLDWDSSGFVELSEYLPGDEELYPFFHTTQTLWLSFVEQKFSATRGVLSGNIRFHGRFRDILPFSLKFNSIAKVSQSVLKQ